MFLFIDTSPKEKMTLALCHPSGDCLARIQLGVQRNHSAILLPALAKLIHKSIVDISTLQGILVHRGPGSFTGVRVGVAIANALGFAWDLSVVGTKRHCDLGPLPIDAALFRRQEFLQPIIPHY